MGYLWFSMGYRYASSFWSRSRVTAPHRGMEMSSTSYLLFEFIGRFSACISQSLSNSGTILLSFESQNTTSFYPQGKSELKIGSTITDPAVIAFHLPVSCHWNPIL